MTRPGATGAGHDLKDKVIITHDYRKIKETVLGYGFVPGVLSC